LKRTAVILFLFLVVFLAWGFYGNGQEEVPVLKNDLYQDQYRETMKRMDILSRTLLDYVEYFNKAPAVKTLGELMEQDCGIGLTFADFFFDEIPREKIPLKDVWQNDFFYKYEKEMFWIASAGSDGKFEGFEQSGVYPAVESHMQGKDIILSSKGFTVFPLEKEKAYFFIRTLLRVLLKSGDFIGSDLEF